MKHITLTLLALCAIFTAIQAQDILVDQGGNETQVIVKKIGQTEVEYIKFDNIDGPLFSMPKTRIFMIKFANGTKEVFGKPSTAAQNSSTKYKEPNRFAITPVDARRKSVGGAVALSFFIAGTGQIYTHSRGIGTAMVSIDMLLLGTSAAFQAIDDAEGGAGWVFYSLNKIYSMIDAGIRASRLNRGEWMYGMDRKIQIAPTALFQQDGSTVPGASLAVTF